MEDLVQQQDITDLGPLERIDAVAGLVSLAGLTVVDVGCGDGTAARQLVDCGAEVIGVEPDPIQAEKNRAAPAVPGLRFIEAPGQSLPLADHSVDGVFYFYSLHHVPAALMDEALAEARRVIKPDRGFLCVVEPLLSGNLEAVYRPFHDETPVRTLAYAAVRRVAAQFATAREYRYEGARAYDTFDAFIKRITGTSYNRITREQVDVPDVRAAFEAGRTADGHYRFSKFDRINLMTGPR